MGADIPQITIPAELLPADGRFGSGPSKVRPAAVAALAEVADTYLGTSHRRPTVRRVVGRVRAGLSELLRLPDGYEVLLGNGGATAFWDAATVGLIVARSQHLSFGEFSAKFAAVVQGAPHLEDPEVIESPPGTHPDPVARAGVDVYALTHNETSTGVVAPVLRPRGGSVDGDALVVVDATSAAGGVRVDPAEFDVYYFSPQKCLASDGGLWLAACSPVAVERIERVAASDRWAPPSLSLALALENSRLDQTYNTPALATLFLLAHQVEWILAHGGLEWAAQRSERSSGTLYRWAEDHPQAMPFVADADRRSPVVATIDLDPAVDAAAVSTILRRHGVVDTESYRKLGRNQLRIACFPAIEPEDVERLTGALDHVFAALTG